MRQKIDMIYVYPRDVMEWAAKHEQEELKEGSSRSLSKESEKGSRLRSIVLGTIRYWQVGRQSMSSLPDGGRHREAEALPLSGMARSKAGYSGVLQKMGARTSMKEWKWHALPLSESQWN